MFAKNMSVAAIIEKLELIPHPEGGFYKETYRSPQTLIAHESSVRNLSTAIYFMLVDEDISRFHRIKSDELWFFHQGEPLEIVLIENSQTKTIVLGNDTGKGEAPQAMIPALTWFGSRIKTGRGYALVSCTVAPGFDFLDFEFAKREDLLNEFSHLKNIIESFTV